MKTLTLHRYYTPLGTFGYLYDDKGAEFCCTCEEVWHGNRPSVPGTQTGSCIPEGGYLCKRGSFPKHGDTFEVTGVPDRSTILFHVGNTVADIEGCIALGNKFGCVNTTWAVLESGAVPDGAYRRFMRALEGEDEFMLVVKRAEKFQP